MSEAVYTAKSLCPRSQKILLQHGVYYNVPNGRLKLRIINTSEAELIYYSRPDKKGSRYSDYFVLPVANPKLLHTLCPTALGQKVVVKKKRRFFLYKNARIHLDDVCGLGTFIEFEILVKYGKRQAQTLLKFLSDKFEIKRSATIAISYSDLHLCAKKKVRKLP